MTIEYTWKIVQLECYPEMDGETDVVCNASWTLEGRDGVYIGSTYGNQAIPVTSGGNFIPYDQLTQAQVVDWVQQAMGADRIAQQEKNIAAQIENQKNPPVVVPPLPWQS